jgi:uncharacterized protein DUF3854
MSVPTRPGISPQTLTKAGVEIVDEPELGSIRIPYFDIGAERTSHCRWRLPKPKPNGQKYTQPPDSGYPVYFPPEPLRSVGGDLYITEGEFKALKLYQEGFQVIGLPGLSCYESRKDEEDGGRCDDKHQLLPGIAAAIRLVKPSRVVFLCDADTSHNYDFARSAHFLAYVLQRDFNGLPVILPRLPADGPKGIDDFGAAHPDDFSLQFKALLENAITIQAGDSIAALMAVLIENQQENLPKLEKGLLKWRLLKLATDVQLCKGASEPDRERIRLLIMKLLGIKEKKTYQDEVKRRIAEVRKECADLLFRNLVKLGDRTVLHLPYETRYPCHVAEDLGEILAPHNVLFVTSDKTIVERNPAPPQQDPLHIKGEETPFPQYPLCDVDHYRLKDLSEHDYVRPVARGHKGEWEDCDMPLGLYYQAHRSPNFRGSLSRITQVIPADLPFRLPDGSIIFPEPGYCAQGQLYVLPRTVIPVPCSLDEARALLNVLLGDALFRNEESRTNYIARLFTPYFRGIMSPLSRTPFWVFKANRERVGKDFLAAVPQIIFLGCFKEEPPLDGRPEETQKRLVSAGVARCLFFHISNQKLPITDDGPLEYAITSPRIGGRYLCYNRLVDIPHTIDFSISLNAGVEFSPDLEARQRIIELEWLEDSDPSRREFKRGLTQLSLLKDRGKYLGMMRRFFQAWQDEGMPPGPSVWATFGELSSFVGGAMKVLGLGDAFAYEPELTADFNTERQAARAIYAEVYRLHGKEWIDKSTLTSLVSILCNESDDADQHLSADNPGFSVRLGKLLNKYNERKLDGYQLFVNKPSANSFRNKYRVVWIGDPGKDPARASGSPPVIIAPPASSQADPTTGSAVNVQASPPSPPEPGGEASAPGSPEELEARLSGSKASTKEEVARGLPPEGPAAPPPPKRKYDYIG